MYRCYCRLLSAVLLLILMAWMASCAPFGSQAPPQREAASADTTLSIDTMVRQVLTNMHLHAWNPQAMTHGVISGGLFINWRMDDPAITNVTRPGPDGDTLHNHDPQVDLLYLTALSEYQQLHPHDQSFAADLRRTLPLVLADFQNYSQPKGWIYFYLLKNGIMNHDAALVQETYHLAGNLYARWYDPRLGFVYDRTHIPHYNTDDTLTSGAALIDAGVRWQQPEWIRAGEKTIDHTLAVALNPRYHLFYYGMLVGNNGSDRVANYKAMPSIQGQIVTALLNAYTLTHRRRYLDIAGEVLRSLLGTSGLWDRARGGFFFALDMSAGRLITEYKETRSQSLALISLHDYNRLLPGRFAQQEQQLVQVLVEHFYQSSYHGFFYRVTTDFHVYVTHPGQGAGVEDYFTTEAMGGALDALQQIELAK
jgi:hypothetical protein